VNQRESGILKVYQGMSEENDSIAKRFVEELTKAAEKKGVEVDVKDPAQSISYSKKFIEFEHQIFTDKGIPAVTLTTSAPHLHRYQKYSVFDTTLSNSELRRNILIISEALVHLVYSFHD
jgi:hypothetical protein